MHIVRDQCAPARRQCATDRPVIAAGQGNLALLRVWRRHTPVFAHRVQLPRWHGQLRDRRACQRRVPSRAEWIHPGKRSVWQYSVCQSSADITTRTAVVEFEKHRVDDQNGIFGPPWRRLFAEYIILEWFRSEACEAGIDARRVPLEQFALGRIKHLKCAASAASEAVQPVAPVDLQRRGTDECGEFSGRSAANQIHLKKTVLAMRITGRKGEILTTASPYRWYPVRIALDDGLGAQTICNRLAIELRQTCPQSQPCKDDNDDARCKDSCEQADQQAFHLSLTRRIVIEFVPPETPCMSPRVNMTRSSTSTRSFCKRVRKISAYKWSRSSLSCVKATG